MLNTTALPLRPRRFVALLLLVAGLLLALAPTAFATTSSDDGA
ncbi:MAG: hypothetical protein ACJA2F_000556, partial [Nitriliruptoraceae bacterium]